MIETPVASRRQAWPAPLISLGALAAILLLCSATLDLLQLPRDGALGRDFSAFYAAGLALRSGHDPYNWAQLAAIEAHLRSIGNPRLPFGFNSYANPPLFTWAMAALTALPDRLAYDLWLVGMLAAALGSVALVARSYGVRGRGWAVLLFVTTPAPVIGFFLGQQTPLLALGLAVALVALRRGWPMVAGAALSVGWIKPHLLLPLVVVLVALLGWRRGRRVLASFLGASALCALTFWLLTGGAPFAAWARDLVQYGHTMDTLQPDLSSLAGLYLSVVSRPWSLYLSVAAVGAWLAFAALLAWQARLNGLGPRDDAWLRLFALALASWLLATPYAHPADLMLLAVALPPVLGRSLEGLCDPLTRLAVAALLIAPESDLLGFRPNFVLSYSVLVPLTILLALWPWRAFRAGQASAGSLGGSMAVSSGSEKATR